MIMGCAAVPVLVLIDVSAVEDILYDPFFRIIISPAIALLHAVRKSVDVVKGPLVLSMPEVSRSGGALGGGGGGVGVGGGGGGGGGLGPGGGGGGGGKDGGGGGGGADTTISSPRGIVISPLSSFFFQIV